MNKNKVKYLTLRDLSTALRYTKATLHRVRSRRETERMQIKFLIVIFVAVLIFRKVR